MFDQEMINAEIIKNSWMYKLFGNTSCKKKLVDPYKLNSFVTKLLHPFDGLVDI